MDERRSVSPSAVGGSSLLVMFGVLCLTVFALLSLSTVQADLRLSERSAAAMQDYYAADTAAETVLARLRAGEKTDSPVRLQDGIYYYTCPISDTQELSVAVELGADGSYRVLRWETVSTVTWAADDSLDLWDGSDVGGDSNG